MKLKPGLLIALDEKKIKMYITFPLWSDLASNLPI